MAKRKVVQLPRDLARRAILMSKVAKLDVGNTSTDNLKAQLALVFRLIPLAEKMYKKYPTDRNCYALTKLIETAVGLMEKIEESKDYELFAEEVDKRVLQELVRQSVSGVSVELRKLREDFLKYIPEEYHEAAKQRLETALRRFGNYLDDKYKTAKEDLAVLVRKLRS